MPGKCKFKDTWLDNEQHRQWIAQIKTDCHQARCICMGEYSLRSHMTTASHIKAVAAKSSVATFYEYEGLHITKEI